MTMSWSPKKYKRVPSDKMGDQDHESGPRRRTTRRVCDPGVGFLPHKGPSCGGCGGSGVSFLPHKKVALLGLVVAVVAPASVSFRTSGPSCGGGGCPMGVSFRQVGSGDVLRRLHADPDGQSPNGPPNAQRRRHAGRAVSDLRRLGNEVFWCSAPAGSGQMRIV